MMIHINDFETNFAVSMQHNTPLEGTPSGAELIGSNTSPVSDRVPPTHDPRNSTNPSVTRDKNQARRERDRARRNRLTPHRCCTFTHYTDYSGCQRYQA